MSEESKKAMLVILDGWGLGPKPERSAIHKAKTPFFDHLIETCPNATLTTFGPDVGLPEGQMGNSEVGHLNIGAGRVVYQELARINKAIASGALMKSVSIQSFIEDANNGNGRIHLMGLYSDGGVHAHTAHFHALIDVFEEHTNSDIFIHAFLDGRDTGPESGAGYIHALNQYLDTRRTTLASVIGRYYAMDRDQRWERTKLAYDMLVHGSGEMTEDFEARIKEAYANRVTDEFMPALVESKGRGRILPGDLVFFVNFRTDRPRQLVQVLVEEDMPDHQMRTLALKMTTMTRYDAKFSHPEVVFDRVNLTNTLGEYLSNLGKSQLRAAETEKYAHVTYFFNGGEEEPFENESRIMMPSPKVATYDLQPEMSAYPLTEKVTTFISENKPDFVCINYANTDMVGHTGVFEAAVKAAEAVDENLKSLVETAQSLGYAIVIIADHGNSDYMINDDGSPHTAHTMNPVPIIIVDEEYEGSVADGKLADVAPTILRLMKIEAHSDMTGDVLTNTR